MSDSSFPSSSMRQGPHPSRPLADSYHYYPRSSNRHQYYTPAEFFYTSQRLPQQQFRSASFHTHQLNDRLSSHSSSKFISAHSTAAQASSQPGTSKRLSRVTVANPYEVHRAEAPHLSIHNPLDASPVRGRCSRRVSANSTSVARARLRSQALFFLAHRVVAQANAVRYPTNQWCLEQTLQARRMKVLVSNTGAMQHQTPSDFERTVEKRLLSSPRTAAR
jgi:hypothetical protein